jgi:hypothetical protein
VLDKGCLSGALIHSVPATEPQWLNHGLRQGASCAAFKKREFLCLWPFKKSKVIQSDQAALCPQYSH